MRYVINYLNITKEKRYRCFEYWSPQLMYRINVMYRLKF